MISATVMSELHEAKRVPTQFTVPRPGEHAWSPTEQRRFWDALQCFPHGPWTDIAAYVGSKSTRQAMTHAQKLRQKLSRWKRRVRSSSKGSTGSKSKASTTVTKATPMATGSPVDGRNALVWPRLMSLTIVRDGGAMRGKSACVEEDGGACDLMDVMDLIGEDEGGQEWGHEDSHVQGAAHDDRYLEHLLLDIEPVLEHVAHFTNGSQGSGHSTRTPEERAVDFVHYTNAVTSEHKLTVLSTWNRPSQDAPRRRNVEHQCSSAVVASGWMQHCPSTGAGYPHSNYHHPLV